MSEQRDAQIETLERGLDEDDIHDRFCDPDTNSNAYDAFLWAVGERDEAPSEDWKELAQ